MDVLMNRYTQQLILSCLKNGIIIENTATLFFGMLLIILRRREKLTKSFYSFWANQIGKIRMGYGIITANVLGGGLLTSQEAAYRYNLKAMY